MNIKMKRRKYLCTECAHEHHRFEVGVNKEGLLAGWSWIDGEKWICYHFSPSHRVKCSECGKKVRNAFTPMTPEEEKLYG